VNDTGHTDAAQPAPDSELAKAAPTVEAVLFAADAPLTAARIAEAAGLPGQLIVSKAVRLLNARYEASGAAYRIEQLAGGYQMLTLPKYHQALSRLHKAQRHTRLSQAALETLAIVAYRQPVLRADVEAIRGVSCGEVLRGLLEKQLVKIVGRAEVLGRPMLYGTTRRFLEVFGLSGLDDLPRAEELRSAVAEGSKGTEPAGAERSPANADKEEEPSSPQEVAETEQREDD
jgi:segregation and condensation protein B